MDYFFVVSFSWFQTNPRGVGGTDTYDVLTTRPVSDQPSWGRRSTRWIPLSRSARVSDQPSWGRRLARYFGKAAAVPCFRPTLVGSEALAVVFQGPALVSDQPSWGRRVKTEKREVEGSMVSDQPSWGRRTGSLWYFAGPSRFRPTLVGSEVSLLARPLHELPVSDQPSWGRRAISFRASGSTRTVSDQPSWGRRFHNRLGADVSAGFRPTLVGSEVLVVTLSCRAIGFRPTLVGSEEPHS